MLACLPFTDVPLFRFDRLANRYYVRLDGDPSLDFGSLLTCYPAELEEEALFVFLTREGKSLGYQVEE